MLKKDQRCQIFRKEEVIFPSFLSFSLAKTSREKEKKNQIKTEAAAAAAAAYPFLLRDGHGGRGEAPTPPALALRRGAAVAAREVRCSSPAQEFAALAAVFRRRLVVAPRRRPRRPSGRTSAGDQLPAGAVPAARPLAPPRRALPRRRLHPMPRLRQWIR